MPEKFWRRKEMNSGLASRRKCKNRSGLRKACVSSCFIGESVCRIRVVSMVSSKHSTSTMSQESRWQVERRKRIIPIPICSGCQPKRMTFRLTSDRAQSRCMRAWCHRWLQQITALSLTPRGTTLTSKIWTSVTTRAPSKSKCSMLKTTRTF